MSISLQVNGNKFEQFTAVEVERSLTAVAGAFRFTAAGVLPKDIPFKLGDPCQVIVEDSAAPRVIGINIGSVFVQVSVDPSVVIDGYIESVQIDASPTGHGVTFEGRDKVADLVDSQVPPGKAVSVQSGTPIKAALEQVLTTLGFTGFKVKTYPDASSFAGKTVKTARSAQTGDRVFDFLATVAAEVTAVLTGAVPGEITLEEIGSDRAEVRLVNALEEDEKSPNNLKQSSYTNDHSRLFSEYHVFGTKAKAKDGVALPSEKAVEKNSEVSRTRISVTANGKAPAKELAQWNLNHGRAMSTRYSCTVRGHFSDSKLTKPWKPGQYVKVQDELSGVYDEMVLTKVRFIYNQKQGSVTELSLVGVGVLSSKPGGANVPKTPSVRGTF